MVALTLVIVTIIAVFSLSGCKPEVVVETVPGETVVVTEIVTETVEVEKKDNANYNRSRELFGQVHMRLLVRGSRSCRLYTRICK